MEIERKEYEKEKEAIMEEVFALFHNRMRVFTWNVPENDASVAAQFILRAMEEALETLKKQQKA